MLCRIRLAIVLPILASVLWQFRANLKLRFTVNLFQSEPSAPDESGPPLIAIGDVHGDLHNLLRALQLVQVRRCNTASVQPPCRLGR